MPQSRTIIFISVLLAVFTSCNMQSGSEKPITLLAQGEAFSIALRSTCSEIGSPHNKAIYNEVTQTWWFEFTPNEPKEGCNPACVVDENTKTAEVNWRCTGLIQE